MRKKQNKITYKKENLKPNLELFVIYYGKKIAFLNMRREYMYNDKKDVFEIFFSSNENLKLSREIHFVNDKEVKEYTCDTKISPNMDEVYKYLHGEKIR